LPAIREAQLEDLLTGADEKSAKTISVKTGDIVTQKANPDYVRWVTHDQALLGYLLSSLTQEILMGVTTLTSHYVRNSNRRHGSETRVKAIVSNLEK
jgi:hypothetical protein